MTNNRDNEPLGLVDGLNICLKSIKEGFDFCSPHIQRLLKVCLIYIEKKRILAAVAIKPYVKKFKETYDDCKHHNPNLLLVTYALGVLFWTMLIYSAAGGSGLRFWLLLFSPLIAFSVFSLYHRMMLIEEKTSSKITKKTVVSLLGVIFIFWFINLVIDKESSPSRKSEDAGDVLTIKIADSAHNSSSNSQQVATNSKPTNKAVPRRATKIIQRSPNRPRPGESFEHFLERKIDENYEAARAAGDVRLMKDISPLRYARESAGFRPGETTEQWFQRHNEENMRMIEEMQR